MQQKKPLIKRGFFVGGGFVSISNLILIISFELIFKSVPYILNICSLVFPFKNADLIAESCVFTFSSTEKCNPKEDSSFSKFEKYFCNSKFSLKELGESDYNIAYSNVKQWFSDTEIEKYSLMAVSLEIVNE